VTPHKNQAFLKILAVWLDVLELGVCGGAKTVFGLWVCAGVQNGRSQYIPNNLSAVQRGS
jgi:hypothetical protein